MSTLITCLEVFYVVIIVLMTIQAVFNIRLLLYIWEKPEQAWQNSAPTIYREPHYSFTIMLPARHEEDVYRDTIQKVYDLNYPKRLIQILAICREDDPGTIAEARAKINELRDPNVQLIIFNDKPINKPHGLNLGLRVSKGDIVTIFDAEDEPHPDILNVINTTFLNENVDVVQSGGVQLMNYNTKWFCFLNVLEYFFWFKSSLHFFASVGMTPLGGNTVFVRRQLMEQLGGWDETCLTEDADLGIRLCLSNARVRIIYDDEFVTREETPNSIEQFIKQRTRWNQGFIQILFRGRWLQLKKFKQRMLALYVLILPEVQAFFALMIPISIALMFVHLPLWMAMITITPLYCFALALFIALAGLHEFVKVHKRKWRWQEAFMLLIAFFPYQILLGIGAIRAVYRYLKGASNWEKTAHVGQHRGNVAAK